MITSDFLVIGGGIAGLTFALEAAKHGDVVVLFKKEVALSSTAWAQGGIAAVSEEQDDLVLHVDDTLKTGGGIAHRDIVELVIGDGPQRIEDLIRHGVEFDKSENGSYHLHREGGHSRRRIYHAADATGRVIHQALLKEASETPRITFIEHAFAIDLIGSRNLDNGDSPNKILGAYVLLQDGTVERFLAKKTLVATGGAGKVYRYTSNPDIATGDGIAMCVRAGCPVGNMEFFQFHPTCLFHPEAKSFLISEALRGEGAVLRLRNGERFMEAYDPARELAPRDVVARAIDSEMKRTGDDFVLLDISHRDEDFIRHHFPNIFERCRDFGIDITKEPIPVVPAAHFLCGGVISDAWGRTSLPNLYVAGECAHTGLHGANRLASNSLLEGVVFGYRAAIDAVSSLNTSSHPNDLLSKVPTWDVGRAGPSEEAVIVSQNWDELRQCMWNYVGIVRSDNRLTRALSRVQLINREINEYYWNHFLTTDLLELRNLNLIAELVIRSSMARKESRGLHFTTDHPVPLPEFERDTIITPEMLSCTSYKA